MLVQAVTPLELIRAIGQNEPVGICVTDALINQPGPAIVYANLAFGRLVGRDPDEIIGLSPRFMQGRETRRTTLDEYRRALSAGQRFHGYLTNYRADGTKYRAEIDCRPLCSAGGQIEGYVAFERAVTRRIGRPVAGGTGRYTPLSVSNDLLSEALHALGVFQTC